MERQEGGPLVGWRRPGRVRWSGAAPRRVVLRMRQEVCVHTAAGTRSLPPSLPLPCCLQRGGRPPSHLRGPHAANVDAIRLQHLAAFQRVRLGDTWGRQRGGAAEGRQRIGRSTAQARAGQLQHVQPALGTARCSHAPTEPGPAPAQQPVPAGRPGRACCACCAGLARPFMPSCTAQRCSSTNVGLTWHAPHDRLRRNLLHDLAHQQLGTVERHRDGHLRGWGTGWEAGQEISRKPHGAWWHCERWGCMRAWVGGGAGLDNGANNARMRDALRWRSPRTGAPLHPLLGPSPGRAPCPCRAPPKGAPPPLPPLPGRRLLGRRRRLQARPLHHRHRQAGRR